MVFLSVISAGILFYLSQKRKIENEKQDVLAAITSLKVEDITEWRREHIRDGDIISNDLTTIKLISSFFDNGNKAEIKRELLLWMQSFIKNYDYQSFLLLDNTRSVRLSFPPLDSGISNSLIATTPDEYDSNNINLTDLRTSNGFPGIYIDLVIPLIATDKNINIGTAVLRIDPENILFPLIQSWPAPSKSSETLLLRREGDSVLYLNELRHQKNTALRLKIPLSNNTLPASRAATGFEGAFEGRDYRNIRVISFMKKIPDTPWVMVAKVDKDEIYSPLNELIALISIIAFLVILSAGFMIAFYLRKENEIRLYELNATKDKFFSIIAHDLKSPFNSIIGLSDLLSEKMHKKDYEGIEEYTEIIQNSAWRAMDLLKNLIVWSQLQTGRLDFRPEPVDLISMIIEVTELSKYSAFQKSISITREIPPDLTIIADKAMINTVLRNLISNAIKFTNPGGKVVISAAENENEVMVTVRDNGIGVKKEIIDKLFLIDSNVSRPGTQGEEGTGLGLILCRDFVVKHGGRIWAESEDGKWMRVTFTIPLILIPEHRHTYD